MCNQNGNVALLKVTKHHYHKLPGGGLEAGEGLHQALHREVLEETGCTIEIRREVGKIIEYRKRYRVKQTSHCYFAQQVGPIRRTSFTEEEDNNGFELLWVEDMQDAIRQVQADRPSDYGGKFIQKRDLAFLKAAAANLPQQ